MGLVADGCFDIGGSVSPVRVSEDLRTRLEVRHPTATLTLARATGPSDLGSAVIDDPRLLLYELATGRLLCRRYLDERVERRSRTGLLAQVRIYVLDGSSSMVGARARMRDALLVSELGALVGRLTAREAYVHSVLYFRYFDHEARPTRRVATVDDALAAVREAVGPGVDLAIDMHGRYDIASGIAVAKAMEPVSYTHLCIGGQIPASLQRGSLTSLQHDPETGHAIPGSAGAAR